MSGLSLSTLYYTGVGAAVGVAPAGDLSSPSELFVNVPTFLDVLEFDLMSYIPEGMRTMEDTGSAKLMRRMTVRPAQLAARIQQKIWRLSLLNDPMRIPESLLDYLLALVGFGTQSDSPARVVAVLGASEKRKLAAMAVAFWKRRGRRSALADSLSIASGVRPAIWTWFDLQSRLGTVRSDFVGIPGIMPYLLNDVGEVTLAEASAYKTDVRICGCTTAALQTLATELCRLARPMNETIRIAFVDFVDTRTEGRLAAWRPQETTTVGGGAGSVIGESVYEAPTRTPSPRPGGVRMTGEMREGLYYADSANLGSHSVTMVLMPTTPATGKFLVHLHQDADAGDSHVVTLDFDAQTLEVGTWLSGVYTGGTLDPRPMLADAFGLRIDVSLQGISTVQITVWIDNEIVLIENFLHGGRDSGTIAFETSADADILIGPVEITHPGMTVTTLGPSTS